MARGKSGRVVLEIDPNLKNELYMALENQQQTMKEWFVKEAQKMIYRHKQPSLFTVVERTSKTTDKQGI